MVQNGTSQHHLAMCPVQAEVLSEMHRQAITSARGSGRFASLGFIVHTILTVRTQHVEAALGCFRRPRPAIEKDGAKVGKEPRQDLDYVILVLEERLHMMWLHSIRDSLRLAGRRAFFLALSFWRLRCFSAFV